MLSFNNAEKGLFMKKLIVLFCFLTSSIVGACEELVRLENAQQTCLKMIAEFPSIPYTEGEKNKIVKIPLLTGTIAALGSCYLASPSSDIRTSLLAGGVGALTGWATCSIIKIIKSGTHKAAFDRLRPQARFYACQQTIGFACILQPHEIDNFVNGVIHRSSINNHYPLVAAQQKFYSPETFMNFEVRPVINSILENHHELTDPNLQSLNNLLEQLNNNVMNLRKTNLNLKNNTLYQQQLQALHIANEAEQNRRREQESIAALQASAQRDEAIAETERRNAELIEAQTVGTWVHLLGGRK